MLAITIAHCHHGARGRGTWGPPGAARTVWANAAAVGQGQSAGPLGAWPGY